MTSAEICMLISIIVYLAVVVGIGVWYSLKIRPPMISISGAESSGRL